MIDIELRPDWDVLRLDSWSIDQMMTLVETVVGQIFEEEMDHVDVSVRPYTEIEVRETPLLIKIMVDDVHHDTSALAETFGEAWKPIWETEIARDSEDNRFRVWVAPIVGGALYEPSRKESKAHAQA